MTYHPKSEFIATMMERGFLADCTDYQGLDEAFSKGVVPAYIGYDGTTKVGDPSFRADERPLLGPEQIDANIAGIKQVFASYLTYGDADTDAMMINNAEWLDGLNYLDFLRDIGRHFSINRMLSFESVKSRLDREQSLSFLEFNYTSSGSSGAIRPMRTQAVSLSSTQSCRLRNATVWARWKGQRSTRRKSSSPMRSRRFCTARTRPKRQRPRPAKSLKRAALGMICRRSR